MSTEILHGKSVSLSFRVPIPICLEIEKIVKRSGGTVSSVTAQLWRSELDRQGEQKNKNEASNVKK